MKTTIAGIGLLLALNVVAAERALDSGWEQQNCLTQGGEVVTLTSNISNPGSFEFCYFFGGQGIDIRTLYEGSMNPYGGPDANRAYRRTLQNDFSACMRNGGTSYTADRSDGGFTRICIFWDGSAIDEQTLTYGVHSPWNRDLNRALGIF
jgi:putative hemolysin